MPREVSTMETRVRNALVICLAAVVAFPAAVSAVEVKKAAAGWQPDSITLCDKKKCTFTDQRGDNIYELRKGKLTRTFRGEITYQEKLSGANETVLLATISSSRNQLAVVIQRSVTTISGLMSSGAHPSNRIRQSRCEIRNPKSGELIKFIDLADYRPQAIALTELGKYVLLYGEAADVFEYQVRIYSSRSGKLEHQLTVAKGDKVKLAGNGFMVNARAWKVVTYDSSGGSRTYNSRDPFSIAEFVVTCTEPLRQQDYQGKALAVIEFTDAEYELSQMLANALTLKLKGAGFEMVERQKIEAILKELHLRGTGLTVEDRAVEIGKLGNAHFLAFGALEEAGTTSSISVRLVGVEDSRVAAGCEVACRDCRQDDYLEAVNYLITSWVQE